MPHSLRRRRRRQHVTNDFISRPRERDVPVTAATHAYLHENDCGELSPAAAHLPIHLSAPPYRSFELNTPHAAWAPQPDQRGYFDYLFQLADADGAGEVTGPAAVAFFSRSGLDRTALKATWDAANLRGGRSLSRLEFPIAMRVVALAQAGLPPTRETLLATASQPLPPPRFVGPWAITPEDASKFAGIFRTVDTDGDGLVSGGEAVGLFTKSGLDRPVLKAIWGLSDMDRDGSLDLEEFAVAMQLVVGASRRGMALPASLPLELVPPSKVGVLFPATAASVAAPAPVAAAAAPPAAAALANPEPAIPAPVTASIGLPPLPQGPSLSAHPLTGGGRVSRPSSGSIASVDEAFAGLDAPLATGAVGEAVYAPSALSPPAPAPAAVVATPAAVVSAPSPQLMMGAFSSHAPAAFAARAPSPAVVHAMPPVAPAVPSPATAAAGFSAAPQLSAFSAPAPAPAAAQQQHQHFAPVAHDTDASASAAIAALRSAVTSETSALAARREALSHARGEAASLQAERESLTAQLAALREEGAAEEAAQRSVSGEIAALRAELASLRHAFESSSAALATTRVRGGEARGVAAALAAQLLAATGRGDALSSQARELLERAGAADLAAARVGAAATEVAGLAAQHAAGAESADDDAAVLQAAVAAAEERAARLQGEVASAAARLGRGREGVAAALATLEAAQGELERARAAHEHRFVQARLRQFYARY